MLTQDTIHRCLRGQVLTFVQWGVKGLSDTQVANIGLAVALVHSLPLFFRKGPRIWAEFTFRTLILALRVLTPFEITAEGYPQAFTGLDCASPCSVISSTAFWRSRVLIIFPVPSRSPALFLSTPTKPRLPPGPFPCVATRGSAAFVLRLAPLPC